MKTKAPKIEFTKVTTIKKIEFTQRSIYLRAHRLLDIILAKGLRIFR